MSNLMVKGTFVSGFLDDYGSAVRTFEQSKGSRFNPASVWGNPPIAAQLDVMRFVLTERFGQREFDVLTYAKEGRLGGFERLRASDVSDNAVASRTRTVVMAPCPKAGKNYVLDLDLPDTGKDRGEDLERFVRSYLPTGLAALGC
ncbi:hypothetical protein OG245_15540 [Streptomyces sp. NBC_01116]|uniref:hypothetical protein n=1 Tax=Streptomyces sp. NBC_01116 TaxID=2903752 RepID=UPI003253E966